MNLVCNDRAFFFHDAADGSVKWLGKDAITPFVVDGKASKTELTTQLRQWAIASGRSVVRPVLIVSYETLRLYVDELKDTPIDRKSVV